MDLNKNSWHVRLFFRSQEICDKFTDLLQTSNYEERTNLCHYVRVICVYMPFVILFHLIGYGAAIAALTYLPFHLFGNSYWYVIGSVAVLATVTYIVCLINIYFTAKAEKKPETEEVQKAPKPMPGKPQQGPGFSEVILAYLAAAKKRICPTVNFISEKEPLNG